jgi:hypothetical protein
MQVCKIHIFSNEVIIQIKFQRLWNVRLNNKFYCNLFACVLLYNLVPQQSIIFNIILNNIHQFGKH